MIMPTSIETGIDRQNDAQQKDDILYCTRIAEKVGDKKKTSATGP